jgi:hypothetical protein
MLHCISALKLLASNLLTPAQTNWNYSAETPDQQRTRLVAGFLDLNLIPIEWMEEDWESLPDPPRAPTAEEIDTILRPYRVDALGWRACNMFHDHTSPILLRTYYSTEEGERAEHDELMNIWVDTHPFEAESWWAVLDNADDFNFGSDWRRIYAGGNCYSQQGLSLENHGQ